MIIGSGPAAHTAAIYAGRAELQPLLFEGFLANGIAAGGQLTTTTDVENFPGFPDGILGSELTQRFRDQSEKCGCKIFTETVTKIDLSSRPFKISTEDHEVTADCVIISTGVVAHKVARTTNTHIHTPTLTHTHARPVHFPMKRRLLDQQKCWCSRLQHAAHITRQR